MEEPRPSAIRLDEPDLAFHIPPADRAKILPGFDADALERLLQRATPENRAELLGYFLERGPDERRGWLVELDDPELTAILEEVWATMWDDAPDQAIEERWYFYPGREIAKERRAARKRSIE